MICGIQDDSRREMSLAHDHRADMNSGVYEEEGPDGVMRDIRSNHAAHELAVPVDVEAVQLPRWQVITNTCTQT
ncbi:DUF2213 domain-containing protein [Caballeronia glebae]|nr:DUF2213 domain-containing protein [Caballeronia glebae]